MSTINDDGIEGCIMLLSNDEYFFIQFLKFETLLQTKVETIISRFVNQLRSEFISFNQSERKESDIINYFQSKVFQFNNLSVIIYFKNSLQIQ